MRYSHLHEEKGGIQDIAGMLLAEKGNESNPSEHDKKVRQTLIHLPHTYGLLPHNNGNSTRRKLEYDAIPIIWHDNSEAQRFLIRVVIYDILGIA